MEKDQNKNKDINEKVELQRFPSNQDIIENEASIVHISSCYNYEQSVFTNPTTIASREEENREEIQKKGNERGKSETVLGEISKLEEQTENHNSHRTGSKVEANMEQDPDYVKQSSEESNSSEDEINKQNNINKPFAVKIVTERKTNRNLGQKYSTSKGKIVAARTIKPLRENCRNKCKNILNENIREEIFTEYWSLGTHDKRVAFISGLVGVEETKITRKKIVGKPTKNRNITYIYKFCIQGEYKVVCKSCFCHTLGETEKFITCVMQNKLLSTSGITHEDLRGKSAPPHKTPQNKIEVVRQHINSFPAYKSHYSRRHTNKNYLPSHLNISIMFKLYCEQYPVNPVSLNIYSREFHSLDLKFKKPKNDTCTKCDSLTAREKYCDNENEKQQIQKELQVHQDAADLAYKHKSMDKEKGLQEQSYVTYAFDLQQVLPTPFLTTNKMFYLRQLSTYNLTVHNCIDGKSTHFMWPETIAGRDANEIASCLYSFIQSIPPGVKHAIFYSDTCGGQNKNIIMISMFQYVINLHPTLEVIEHKFLVPGHTHLECDVDHSIIERAKKRSPIEIHVPRDWYQLVRNASRKNRFTVFPMEGESFYSFSDLHTKGPLQKKSTFKLRDVSWLRYTKADTVTYKCSLQYEEPFNEISFFRKGQKVVAIKNFKLTNLYNGQRPINPLKKQNLLEIVGLLDKTVQSFYRDLKIEKKVAKDTDPDVDRYYSDEDSE